MKAEVIDKWAKTKKQKKKVLRKKFQADEKRWRDERLSGCKAKLSYRSDVTRSRKVRKPSRRWRNLRAGVRNFQVKSRGAGSTTGKDNVPTLREAGGVGAAAEKKRTFPRDAAQQRDKESPLGPITKYAETK